MKKVLLFAIIFTFIIDYGRAQTVVHDPVTVKKYYIGVDLVRTYLGDLELSLGASVDRYVIIEISGGYDFNFHPGYLSGYKKVSKDYEGYAIHSEEEHNHPEARLYWGEGIAARINIYYLFNLTARGQTYFSVEGMYKKRDYEHLLFQDLQFGWTFNESANQTKSGVTLYVGQFKSVTRVIAAKIYAGVGIRWLESDISRHAHLNEPEYDFKNRIWAESLSAGLAVYF